MKKKIFMFATLFILSVATFAQFPRTKFKGIPVDGFKKDMIQKLVDKGFEVVEDMESTVTGQFNGYDVNISIATNNNKVCRIMITDKNPTDENGIKNRFNMLCRQFANNRRYVSYVDGDQTIPDDTDLDYEINVRKKSFEAIFFQKVDTSEVHIELRDKGSDEEANNREIDEFNDPIIIVTDNFKMDLGLTLKDLQVMMPVWFRIAESYGKYYICMYYDNELNRAQGEEL